MAVSSFLALLCCVLLWSSAFVGIEIGLSAYSPGSLALLRFLITSLILLIYFFSNLKNQKNLFRSKTHLIQCFLVGATLAGYMVGLNIGEKNVSSSLASFIVSTEPLMIIIISALFLKEKLTFHNIFGLLISIIGILIIFSANQRSNITFDWSALVILLATFSIALYSIFQKPLFKYYTGQQILPWYMWCSTLILLPYFPQLIGDIHKASWDITLVIIYLGIFPTLLAFTLWTYAISKIPVSKAVSIFYIIPFFTMIMDYLLLGESINILAFLGGCLTLTGAIIVNLPFLKILIFKKK